ncbi:hypothetical protein EYV94_01755 [Puteibacter caeruleilacunae]|nr:hypothetical protein EYV94_01755 [Puteibacter caeruleilacunae]
MIDTELEVCRGLVEEGKLEDAYLKITQLLEDHDENVEANLLAADICSKMQNMGGALNHYNRVLDLDPENKVAKSNASMLGNIFNFRYTDLYNP